MALYGFFRSCFQQLSSSIFSVRVNFFWNTKTAFSDFLEPMKKAAPFFEQRNNWNIRRLSRSKFLRSSIQYCNWFDFRKWTRNQWNKPVSVSSISRKCFTLSVGEFPRKCSHAYFFFFDQFVQLPLWSVSYRRRGSLNVRKKNVT